MTEWPAATGETNQSVEVTGIAADLFLRPPEIGIRE
jgi:hypothetical protein